MLPFLAVPVLKTSEPDEPTEYETPVAITDDPELPETVVPELNINLPLSPAETLEPLAMVADPLDPDKVEPELSTMLPLLPAEADRPEANTSAPLPPLLVTPELNSMNPDVPIESDAPDTTEIAPLFNCELPLNMDTSPLTAVATPADVPLPIVTLPDPPFSVVPELSTINPVEPEETALDDRMNIAPDEDTEPPPVAILTMPPVAPLYRVLPAATYTFPPFPLEVVPTAMETEPAAPNAAVPVARSTAPTTPL